MAFSNLKAVYINCTLKTDPNTSHTQKLLDASAKILTDNGVVVDQIHPLSHQIAFGVQPDMKEHGWANDDWPDIWQRVDAANIVVIGTPIWLGEESSVCRLIIERLYAMSGKLNEDGQSIFYGKVGGCVVTGNEDGIKQCAKTVLYALQHIGFVIPPQADCGWIGEAGPGPSYGDVIDGKPVGFDNEFTQRNTTIMTWNLIHMASMLEQAGGLPNTGNDRNAWQAGCRFDFENPDYRA